MATKKHKTKITLELTFNQALGLLKAAEWLDTSSKEDRFKVLGKNRLVGPSLIALDNLREQVESADYKRMVTVK